MNVFNKIAYVILLIFWILNAFIKIDYAIPLMYLALMFIFLDEYLIYSRDKKEMIFLIPQRKKSTQDLLNFFYLVIIIISLYSLDKLNILRLRDTNPSESLLGLMIWGLIIVKGLIFSDYLDGYKFLLSGFKTTGLTRKKERWFLLKNFKIDIDNCYMILTFNYDKSIKIEFHREFDKQRLMEIEKYLNDKINVA